MIKPPYNHFGSSLTTILMDAYRRLLDRYGPQGWWPSDSHFETIVGAILTQNTAWSNAEKAMANLKKVNALTPGTLREMPHKELAVLLRPSHYFNSKAHKLRAFALHLARYNDDLAAMLGQESLQLREELLGIYGIGEETADDIVLYAAHKPSFVIDTYTRRIVGRLSLSPSPETYRMYKQLFEGNLPADAGLFSEFHALLDYHAKKTCRKRPLCHGCCLLELCPSGQAQLGGNPTLPD